MMFDYRRFYVISVLILLGLIGVQCQGNNEESNQRIQQLEELVLTYLRLSKLENEQQLKLLGQEARNNVQPYYTSEYDNSGWLQNSYDLTSYPEPLALWRGGGGGVGRGGGAAGVAAANPRNVANPRLLDSLTNGRRSKVPSTSITSGGGYENTMFPLPYNLNGVYGYPSSTHPSYLPQFFGGNPYIPPYMPANNDRLRNPVPPFFVDDYNPDLGQPPSNRKLVANPRGRLQDNEGYQFGSMISEPFGGLGMRPPQMRERLMSAIGDGNSNFISTNTEEFNGLPGRANVKSSATLNNGQGSVDIDTSPAFLSDSNNNQYINGVQPTTSTILKGGGGKAPKVKVHGKNFNGNIIRDTKSMGGGAMKPAGKKYKLLIVDGESSVSDGVNFDKMHQELFAAQGHDSAGGVQTNAQQITEESSSSGSQPRRTFQSVSTSNNGAGESTNVVSFQGGLAGDGTTTTVVEENQPRDLSAKYSGNTGYGSFSRMNMLPATTGFQNIRLN